MPLFGDKKKMSDITLCGLSPELTPVSTGWTCHRTRPSQCCMRRCWPPWRRRALSGWNETRPDSQLTPDQLVVESEAGLQVPYLVLFLIYNGLYFIAEADETFEPWRVTEVNSYLVLHLHVLGTYLVTHAITCVIVTRATLPSGNRIITASVRPIGDRDCFFLFCHFLFDTDEVEV